MYTLNCKGKLLVIDKPIVMGIINITPDSFFSDSRQTNIDKALHKAEQMLKEGATILDIGGQSTRPGTLSVGIEEELKRVVPVVEKIHQFFPDTILSIDTYLSKVALETVNTGVSIVNDISAGYIDEFMLPTVASLKVPYVCMHMKGQPETMQQYTSYENVTREVIDFLISRVEECRLAGIHDIIIDPGFGFSKTISHNFELLRHLTLFNVFRKPILLGISRKSTIYKTLGITPEDALNGTSVLNTIGLMNGADILRVHDVKEAMEVIRLVEACK